MAASFSLSSISPHNIDQTILTFTVAVSHLQSALHWHRRANFAARLTGTYQLKDMTLVCTIILEFDTTRTYVNLLCWNFISTVPTWAWEWGPHMSLGMRPHMSLGMRHTHEPRNEAYTWASEWGPHMSLGMRPTHEPRNEAPTWAWEWGLHMRASEWGPHMRAWEWGPHKSLRMRPTHESLGMRPTQEPGNEAHTWEPGNKAASYITRTFSKTFIRMKGCEIWMLEFWV